MLDDIVTIPSNDQALQEPLTEASTNLQEFINCTPRSSISLNENCFLNSSSKIFPIQTQQNLSEPETFIEICNSEYFEPLNYISLFDKQPMLSDPSLNNPDISAILNESSQEANQNSNSSNYLDKNVENTNVKAQEHTEIRFISLMDLKNFKLYSDLIDLIAKLIYFREEIDLIITNYLKQDNKEIVYNTKICELLNRNSDYDLSLFFHKESNWIVKNLMLLIYITLDFSEKNEKYHELHAKYVSLTTRLSFCRRYVISLNMKLKEEKLSEESKSKIRKKIEMSKVNISNILNKRKQFPKRPLVGLVSNYLKFISDIKGNLGTTNTQWVAVFHSVFKITNFFEQNLKEIVGDYLNEFRCPVPYKNREILLSQNPLININSFSYLLIDWILYFFSDTFKESLKAKHNESSKILSRITGLIFILLSDPGTVKTILSKKEVFNNWMINLESHFDIRNSFNTYGDLIKEICDRTKGFKGYTSIKEHNSSLKMLYGYKLKFSAELEEIIQNYLSSAYESGYSTINSLTL